MNTQRKRSRKQEANVTNLADVRASREVPTRLAAWLAERTGGKVISERPGHLVVLLPDEHTVEVSAKEINIFRKEAEAYKRLGEPIPDHVIRDMEQWDREHGRH